MIVIEKNDDGMFLGHVFDRPLGQQAFDVGPMSAEQLRDELLANGCHPVDIADAFHALELGWEYRDGEWYSPDNR